LTLVLGTNIHTLDDDTALIREDVDNLTALTFILEATADDFNSIAFSNLDSHLNTPTPA
jgi:hypothetical protein